MSAESDHHLRRREKAGWSAHGGLAELVQGRVELPQRIGQVLKHLVIVVHCQPLLADEVRVRARQPRAQVLLAVAKCQRQKRHLRGAPLVEPTCPDKPGSWRLTQKISIKQRQQPLTSTDSPAICCCVPTLTWFIAYNSGNQACPPGGSVPVTLPI